MQVRIFRRFEWKIDCPTSELRFGGSNPMKLVPTDELQWCDYYATDDRWIPVPVVEDEKPEHPANKRDRLKWEKINAESSLFFDQLKKDGKMPPPFEQLLKIRVGDITETEEKNDISR